MGEMIVELYLTADIEQALVEQAKLQGTTPEQLALEGLRRQFVHPLPNEHSAEAPRTLADFLGEAICVLHSHEYIPGGAHMSEDTGGAFTKALVEKRRKGCL
ncbi:MAG: hypothetical protein ACR2M0_08215 [Chloroflexia bacterium]